MGGFGSGAGQKPLEKVKPLSSPSTLVCLHCNQKLNVKEFYDSSSEIHRTYMKIPYCKECLDEIYQMYYERYKKKSYTNPEKKAIERVCMIVDLYYSDKIFNNALEKKNSGEYINATLIGLYLKQVKLYQYRNRDYDTTLSERFAEAKDANATMSIYTDDDIEVDERVKEATKLFGTGLEKDDYIYLYEQYMDWTSRHECNTKAQEEVFIQLCFIQLKLLKANRENADTKDLTAAFQKLLDAGKLQPKQNAGDTVADNQTFGTLIDKWENTRPLPEIDEELKDVDKVGLYIDTFFRGHLAKMMGMKNGLSNLYTKFMKKYTVEKPEYEGDDDNEALFDALFGGDLSDE